MTPQKTFPMEYSESELLLEAADLSKRIVGYDSKGGNAEHLMKDSVLFNVTYIELQNRKASRTSLQMMRLTLVSLLVALISLLVAWLSYDASQSADKWQEKQIALLNQVVIELSAARKLQEQLISPKVMPTVTTPIPSTSKIKSVLQHP
jgi:predicted PurR-regulated permease PerM